MCLYQMWARHGLLGTRVCITFSIFYLIPPWVRSILSLCHPLSALSVLGVYAIYITLFFLTWYLADKLQLKGLRSGQYGSPPSLNYWVRQLAVYVVSLTSMKLLVVALVSFLDVLSDIAAWLLSWLGNGDTAQVILCVRGMIDLGLSY